MIKLFSVSPGCLAVLGLLLASPAHAQSAATPRIPPLEESQWTEEQAKVFGPLKEGAMLFGVKLKAYNVMGTIAQHEAASQKFSVWGNHIMGPTNTLPPREREILILRIGWLCQAEYEWGQHAVIGKAVGLTDEEIARIKLGADAPGWSAHDADLIRAADELRKDAMISDATWNALAKTYNRQQMMDVVFTVGQYNMVSMALKSFGVQLDEGVKGF